MKITFYGTRGSLPVSRPDTLEFGGNTTSVLVDSECLPAGVALAIDAGSGFLPLSLALLGRGVMQVELIFTHFHYDHVQGLLLAPHTYIPNAGIRVWGATEHGVGPLECLDQVMQPPYHPVSFAKVKHRFSNRDLGVIGTKAIVSHPAGGIILFPIEKLNEALVSGRQVNFPQAGKFSLRECLVIRILKTVHPEYACSYRFDEMPTGKSFVFLTDHENTDGIPGDLLAHIKNADIMVQDCQYSRQEYEKGKAGFGHGTPDYCVRLALAANVKLLGLTHHDPASSDAAIQEILDEARAAVPADSGLSVIALHDYETVEV